MERSSESAPSQDFVAWLTRSPAHFVGGLLGATFAAALITSSQAAVVQLNLGGEAKFFPAFLRHCVTWFLGLSAVPLVYRLHGWSLGRFSRAKYISLHLGTSLLGALVVNRIVLGVFRLRPELLPRHPMQGTVDVEAALPWVLMPGFVGYWLAFLISTLIRNARAVRQAARREAELEATLDRARYVSLRQQIHPHFLFNTLNTISGLLGDGDSGRAQQAVFDLSAMLRSTLEPTSEELTTVEQEVLLTRRYVAIQALRFGKRLEVSWSLEDRAGAAGCPPLLLLTLVENAVEHTLSQGGGVARILIRTDLEPDGVQLEVRDNGPGFPPELLAGDFSATQGIGLKNSRERLRLAFGAEHEFTLENPEGGGAVVRVGLPWKTKALS